MTTVKELQAALGVKVDGIFGPVSSGALLASFVNLNAPPVTGADLTGFALRLGCSLRQLQAVAQVESGGSAFDAQGRPKMLFERHLFHRLTNGEHSPAVFSSPQYGGYDVSSWAKLAAACSVDPDAAFGACSWGKFQVLGLHWSTFGLPSAFALARSTVKSEKAHYELLALYIEKHGMNDALRALSRDPDDCRAFAQGFNGPAYARHGYHTRLAAAMERGA